MSASGGRVRPGRNSGRRNERRGPVRTYLDHNATSPARPEARDAAVAAMSLAGNPSSAHREGRKARALVEDAREAVAALVDAGPREAVFTSGGTEANNLALLGCGRPRVLVSAVEHPSVLQAAPFAERIAVDREGRIDLSDLDARLASDDAPALVSVMAANNETGVLQPLREVLRLARGHGALIHCDAVQAAGRTGGGWSAADLLTLSSHKLGGLQGAGALVVRDGLPLAARIRGGGQEFGLRAGTEALPALAAFGAACRAARDDDWERVRALRDDLEARLLAAAPGAEVLGAGAGRLPNTTAIAHPAVDAPTMVMSLDLEGVAVSAGAACSSGKMAASHVAEAMGRGDLARRAVRFSLGRSTTLEDCARAVAAWTAIHDRLARPSHAA